jgi:hypothetical protein
MLSEDHMSEYKYIIRAWDSPNDSTKSEEAWIPRNQHHQEQRLRGHHPTDTHARAKKGLVCLSLCPFSLRVYGV